MARGFVAVILLASGVFVAALPVSSSVSSGTLTRPSPTGTFVPPTHSSHELPTFTGSFTGLPSHTGLPSFTGLPPSGTASHEAPTLTVTKRQATSSGLPPPGSFTGPPPSFTGTFTGLPPPHSGPPPSGTFTGLPPSGTPPPPPSGSPTLAGRQASTISRVSSTGSVKPSPPASSATKPAPPPHSSASTPASSATHSHPTHSSHSVPTPPSTLVSLTATRTVVKPTVSPSATA